MEFTYHTICNQNALTVMTDTRQNKSKGPLLYLDYHWASAGAPLTFLRKHLAGSGKLRGYIFPPKAKNSSKAIPPPPADEPSQKPPVATGGNRRHGAADPEVTAVHEAVQRTDGGRDCWRKRYVTV